MLHNEGSMDRMGRVIVALVAFLVALWAGFGSVAGVVLLIAAGIMLATAVSGSCLLYMPFGLSTCRRPARRS